MPSSALVQDLAQDALRKKNDYPETFWGQLLRYLEHYPDGARLDTDRFERVVNELLQFSAGETIGLSAWARELLVPSFEDRRQDRRTLNNFLTMSSNQLIAPRQILNDVLTVARSATLSHEARQLLRI